MIMTMGLNLIFILLFIKVVKNDIIYIKNFSSCVNDKCEIVENHFSDEVFQSTSDTDFVYDFSTEKENEEIVKITKPSHKNGNNLKLIGSNDNFQDEFHIIKLPKLMVPKKSLNENVNTQAGKVVHTNDNQLNGKPNVENITGLVTENETTTSETPKNSINDTNINLNKDIHINRYDMFNESEICSCDLKVNDCDVNCCCDRDCSANMKMVFTSCCTNSANKVSLQFCLSPGSIFKNNLQRERNGLLCIVRNNLHPYVKFKEEMIIDNVTNFKKRISQKVFYSYSPFKFSDPEIQTTPYRFGNIIWSLNENDIFPFGLPKQHTNMQCNSKRNIFYLINYETECMYSVPKNREECMTESYLGMEYFLNHKLIKSPTLIASANSSEKICSNETCIEIIPYICFEESNFSSCVKSSPKRLQWNVTCRNLASFIEYHIYHNGTDGLKEVRAYFTLATFRTESFIQKIRVKFFWAKKLSPVFKRSGNPGYIIGKPIITGKKVYSNNDTTPPRKEAIELSYNPEEWLTVIGGQSGICSPLVRRPVTFGENAYYSCLVNLTKFDYRKKKCNDLQESLFQLLLGKDFTELKANNLNKFVAVFGNSEVENTGHWVQIISEVPSMIPAQIITPSNSDYYICKNIVSDLFIDVAYSRIGPIEKSQNKILGVRLYFGSPRYFVYNTNSNFGSDRGIKISTYVHFIDLTRKAHAEFAETPGFEAKLPHDFFYPFFSAGCLCSFNIFLIIIALIVGIF